MLRFAAISCIGLMVGCSVINDFEIASTPDAGAIDAGASDAGSVDAAVDASVGIDASCELGTLENCAACGESCVWSCTPDGCNDPIALFVAPYHACVALARSGVACWGSNDQSQLGDGSTIASTLPVMAAFDGRFVDVCGGGGISGTAFSCAMSSSGIVSCWGSNLFGMFGSPSPRRSEVPVVVDLPDRAAEIDCGDFHVCARLANDEVWCWGLLPVEEVHRVGPFASPPTAISIGNGHGCAITEGAGIQCWGSNSGGELGDRTVNDSAAPVTVVGFDGDVTRVAAGIGSCAVDAAGDVWCWGASYGPVPVVVNGVSDPLFLETGCAGLTDGVVCWGSADMVASRVPGTSGPFVEVESQFTASCALASSGAVYCWGNGHLGSGVESSVSAIPVTPPTM
jgi:alpha-tubulin suppressor-like RCC1 family protein